MINFQGRILQPSGDPVTTGADVYFYLYPDPVLESTTLWTELQTNVSPDAQGVFSVVLGKNTPINIDASQENLWLKIVWGGMAFTPKQRLVAVPYAFYAITAESAKSVVSGGAGAVPVGTIVAFGGPAAPSGWLLCTGDAVSRSTYVDLYNVIGTIYGVGDNLTTFNLPDLRHRVPVGLDSSWVSFEALNKNGGEQWHSLTAAELVSHTHTQNIHGHSVSDPTHAHAYTDPGHTHGIDGNTNTLTAGTGYDVDRPSGTLLTYTRSSYCGITITAAGTGLTVVSNTAVNQSTGGSQPFSNLQPYITINYIIKY